MQLSSVYGTMMITVDIQPFFQYKEADMKHFGKILALLAAAGGLLALTALLCRRRKRRKRASYITLFRYDE